MTDTVQVEVQTSSSSEPPAAKIGRAYIDAVGDVVQNLALLGVTSWFFYIGKLDAYWWIGIVGPVFGVVNVSALMDRFTKNRMRRGALGMGFLAIPFVAKAVGAGLVARG